MQLSFPSLKSGTFPLLASGLWGPPNREPWMLGAHSPNSGGTPPPQTISVLSEGIAGGMKVSVLQE